MCVFLRLRLTYIPCVSTWGKFLRGADWWGFLLNRRFRQSRSECRCYLWEVFCNTDQDGSAPWAVAADVPVKSSIKYQINYQQLQYSSKVSEFWNEPMPLCQKDPRLCGEGPRLSISLGWITYISSVTDEAWIHSVNSVQMWFILIVALGLAVAPLQNGSVHEKMKAETLIWNLFVNSGLWDEDRPSTCKWRPAEAWTPPGTDKHSPGHALPARMPSATALTLRELALSWSRMHVLPDWAYVCGSWSGVPARRLANVCHAESYLCSGFDEKSILWII